MTAPLARPSAAPFQAHQRLIQRREESRPVRFGKGRRSADRIAHRARAQIRHDRPRRHRGADVAVQRDVCALDAVVSARVRARVVVDGVAVLCRRSSQNLIT